MINTKDMSRTTVYLSADLIKQVKMMAEKDRRSFSFKVTEILERAVNRKNAKKGSI